jgi:hypothetical protein
MKKMAVIAILVLAILSSSAISTPGNPYPLQSGNRIILPPDGWGINLNGSYVPLDDSGQGLPISIDTKVSYNFRSSISVVGEFTRDLSNNECGPVLLTATYYSPVSNWNGYLVYLDYNLTQGNSPKFGLSIWANLDFLYTFVNLESNSRLSKNEVPFLITPGVNLVLSSKIQVNSKLAIQPKTWKYQDFQVGVNYMFNRHLGGKLIIEKSFEPNLDLTYNTGVIWAL